MDNDEKLINLFVTCPALYSKAHREYKDRNVKENLWKVISVEMGKDVATCEKRVSQLRERYNRERKIMKERCVSGAGASQPSTWPLFALCSFFGEHVRARKTFANGPVRTVVTGVANAATEEATGDPDDPLEVVIEEIPHHTCPPSSASSSTDSSHLKIGETPAKRFRGTGNTESLVAQQMKSLIEAANKMQNSKKEATEDETFGAYVASAIKGLSEETKDDVKLQIMQAITMAKRRDRDLSL